MMKFFKWLFGISTQAEVSPLFKESQHQILENDNDEKLSTLLDDGHYESRTHYSTPNPIDPRDLIDPRYKDSHLVVPTTLSAVIDMSERNKQVIHRPTDKLLVETWSFLETELKDIVKLQLQQENFNLSQFLKGTVEEKLKEKNHEFFLSVYQTFQIDENQITYYKNQLPSGAVFSNLLSWVWLFEECHLKSRMFLNEMNLLYLIKYASDTLDFKTLHLENEIVGEFVLFQARKQLMIEINDRYDFESSHPYALRICKGLIFENHRSLFANEHIFNWMLTKVDNSDVKNPVFFNELTRALLDTNSLLGSAPIERLNAFFGDSFGTKMKKLRPSEVSERDGLPKVNIYKAEIKSF